ncbi:peptidoglycan/LPS O-acetylase OafA/YrhL [Paucibacter oligotrophus]|uniref:Peptidoglycan/LPS O-acetylase OafA/YrhL n=1 Tax=Roseateles oligotrophus TaxID=1769250 RepID=A0A840L092_9BURK|nr:acyltransferase [Roseateles oligotrophus]MBB4841670.1 peptidoglycan/LPS O-acetylase OafA/YrhL [Roseateles oligotrophus]
MNVFRQASSPHPRLQGLDTLRALAILLVFATHYQDFVSGQPTFGWASTLGRVGVDLFFVLSGYLIANQIFAGMQRDQVLSLRNFYARRFLRTLPVFYLVLAAYFLFPTYMGGKTPPDLWRFLTFTQNWQLQPGTAFSHAWSLCVEEQFYLVLPAVVLLAQFSARWLKSIAWAWLLLFGLVGLAIRLRAGLWAEHGLEVDGYTRGYYPHIYYATLARADGLLPGVAIALLKNFHPSAWAAVQRRGQVLLLGGLLACGLTAWGLLNFYYVEGYGYGRAMTVYGYSLVSWSFGLLLLTGLCPTSSLARWRLPGAASLALWSYSIYLTHKAVMFALPKFWLLDRQSGTTLLAIALACLALGWLLYRLVELPLMNWRDGRVPSSFKATETAAPLPTHSPRPA